MRKIPLSVALACALLVAACASVKNPISKLQLDVVENSYGVSYAIALGYRDACAKRLIPPSCRIVVPKVQAIAVRAQRALIGARDLVDNHPTIDAVTAINTADAAVRELASILAANGIK